MSEKFDLLQYGLAKEIVADLPKLRQVLETTRESLQPFKKYRDAAQLIDQIDESLVMLDLQYQVYESTLKNKGKVKA